MKVLQLNIFGNLSTGRIAVDIDRTLRDHGYDGMVAFSRNTIDSDVKHFQFGNRWTVMADGVMTRLTDRAGFFSKGPTRSLIRKIREYDPDIVHLHNIHGYYVNIDILFNYLRQSRKRVVWTLHDCWSFTGHCCNFESVGCEKWKTGCNHCPQKRRYPASLFIDNSVWNYNRRRALFTGMDSMTLVTPSEWLKGLVSQSFLREYPTVVIRNGINREVFKPTYGDWIRRNNLEGKKIVLGVASTWTPTKGLDDMVCLSAMLPETYKVVVVGVSEAQQKTLPESVLGIIRTYDSRELAEIYTSAHVFVNPTYDDNFPNVNIEALSCGTQVITYNTGGSGECINALVGRIVPQGDIDGLKESVMTIRRAPDECVKKAGEFDRSTCYRQYIDLYRKILEG